MNELEGSRDEAMERLVRVLETAPAVVVSEDFAARVMARVPREPQRRYVLRRSLQPSRIGQSLAFGALLVLVIAMLLLAPRTASSGMWQSLQGLLFLQLLALLLWMGVSYRRLL